jgi:two-component system response regulator YesN
VFKKNEGVSIINYLISQRITEAKRLLTEGATSLKDVATLVGYNDYNYFSRIFKKNVGCSPKDFALKGNE